MEVVKLIITVVIVGLAGASLILYAIQEIGKVKTSDKTKFNEFINLRLQDKIVVRQDGNKVFGFVVAKISDEKYFVNTSGNWIEVIINNFICKA